MFVPHSTQRGQKLLQRVWWLAAITLSFILLLCVNVTAGESLWLVFLRLQLPEEKSVSHIRRFVLLHFQYDHVLLQELILFTGKKNAILAPLHETDVHSSFSSLCRQSICSSGSSWDDTRKTLPSFSIYFSRNLTSNSWKNSVFTRPIPCVISLLKLLATTFPLKMTFSRTPLCSRIYQTSALCYPSVYT